jgi:hypothetical protein
MADLAPKDIPILYGQYGSLKAIARGKKTSFGVIERLYHKAVEQKLMEPLTMGRKSNQALKSGPRVQALKTKSIVPPQGVVTRFIVTSAQNNTKLHDVCWSNLMGLAKHYDAKVLVSTYLYNKTAFGQQANDKARLKGGTSKVQDLWFDERIAPFICNDRVKLAKGLVFCGELNILPTAEAPLSGLEVYTGRASMIVPHAKLAMESIATLGGDGAKLNYTTGTVTLRNYIQRKEGFKAEFHHSYGALIVEVDEDGHWWVRQLNADSDGTIYDWDLCAKDGKVTSGHRVEAITHGDIHEMRIKRSVETAVWGKDGVVDQLNPRFQFIEDLLDFKSRSHHDVKNPFKMFERHVRSEESVSDEIASAADFLRDVVTHKGCETIVIDSNHDRHLMRWLAEADARKDPINMVFWHRLSARILSNIEAGRKFVTLEEAIGLLEKVCPAKFIDCNTSFVICKDFGGGIECGMHGDLPFRAGIGTFAKFGRRSNTAHSHSACIRGGAYRAGKYCEDRMDYNDGPSAWSDTMIVTYPNSKRTLVTIYKGKSRA